jgi:hypothetical protein
MNEFAAISAIGNHVYRKVSRVRISPAPPPSLGISTIPGLFYVRAAERYKMLWNGCLQNIFSSWKLFLPKQKDCCY